MEKRITMLGKIRNAKELAIREKTLKFVNYYESKGPYPRNKNELSFIEFEACRLIAASMAQADDKNVLDKMINQLGGYELFVDKMCELARESVKQESDSRIQNKMKLENIEKMKLEFLSVSDTINALLEEKNHAKERI